ncbi:hypothetical protein B296_00019065 [Ensete ventricosum]|uniref:Beta-amylase n=1 Tax=Ensete ventricosum TaxID=4639 RepID=A0A426XQ79_ENSVE|nr:hypothetical protein B296_00019065 [Ensete ventricosum]
MAAIAAPPSSVAAFVPAACARPAPASVSVMPALRLPFRRHVSVSSRLYCSKSSSGFDESLDGSASCAGIGGTLHPALPPPTRSGRGVPVFVTLPADAVTPSGRMTRRKTMGASFMALAAAGVEGITVECWWGIVEREAPGVYDWGGYMDLVMMARRYGLKVRAIIAFHQWGTGPGDPYWERGGERLRQRDRRKRTMQSDVALHQHWHRSDAERHRSTSASTPMQMPSS